MMRHKFLKMDEIMEILNSSDEEDEVTTAVHRSTEVNVVYIPPEVDETSDTEQINDEIIEFNEPLAMDIAGSVELEYEVVENYPEDQEETERSLKPPPKKFKSQDEYGPASWRKRPFKYSKEPAYVEATKIEGIVQELGKYY